VICFTKFKVRVWLDIEKPCYILHSHIYNTIFTMYESLSVMQ